QPEWAAISAAWWWASHGLNDLADRGEFAAITRRINGGLNGQAERLALWERAKAVLS
ncbi:glycoside hydrolase family 19 protein, partial [Pseudomonas aeruginosa]|nr:glycoside hydrolase family 19 protein [Pseudomonas aeruginosa]